MNSENSRKIIIVIITLGTFVSFLIHLSEYINVGIFNKKVFLVYLGITILILDMLISNIIY